MWIEFYKLEPFGRDADFQGHAQTAAMIYNTHRGEGTDPLETKDFMPKKPEPPQTVHQMKQFASGLAAIGLGTFEDK